jgi:hypothetical protein
MMLIGVSLQPPLTGVWSTALLSLIAIGDSACASVPRGRRRDACDRK